MAGRYSETIRNSFIVLSNRLRGNFHIESNQGCRKGYNYAAGELRGCPVTDLGIVIAISKKNAGNIT